MSGVLFFLAAAAASTASKPGPIPGEVKTFADWAVGCNNGRACQAVSLMEMETTDNQLTLLVTRGPGRTDVAALSIANIEVRQAGEQVSLAIEGGAALQSANMPEEGKAITFVLDKALFEAVRNARYLELRRANGERLGHASLRGISAAMLYIDDKQLRAKTTTALMATGTAAPTSVPAAPALPQINYRLPSGGTPDKLMAAEIDKLRKMSGCDAELEDAARPTEVVALDKSKALAFLSCGNGAYNFSAVPYVVSRGGKARKFQLAQFDLAPGFSAGDGLTYLVNAGWDAATGTLSSYNKGRGLGDCGTAENYVWDGKRFRLTQQRVMGECRGVIDWITVWRAKAVAKK